MAKAIVRKATVASAAPGPRARPMAASREDTVAHDRRRGGQARGRRARRAAPRRSRSAREAAARSGPSPCELVLVCGSAEERDCDDEKRSTRDEVEHPTRVPSREGSEIVIHTSPAASSAVANASPSPTGETTLSRSTSATGARRRRPRCQQRRFPRATTHTDEATALDSSRRAPRAASAAPNHPRRRMVASKSRRMPRAARIVNASSSAAPSPPTSRRRVPATLAERSASRNSSTGASTANDVDRSVSSTRARSVSATSSSMSQSLGAVGPTGQHPRVCAVRASKGRRRHERLAAFRDDEWRRRGGGRWYSLVSPSSGGTVASGTAASLDRRKSP